MTKSMNKSIFESKIKRLLTIYQSEGLKSSILNMFIYVNGRFFFLKKDGRNGLIKYIFYKIIYRNILPHPYKIIYINPDDIRYMVAPAFLSTLSKYYTYVIPGDWDIKKTDITYFEREQLPDQKLIPVENYRLYRAFKDHFINNTPWTQTEFYKWKLREIYCNRTSSWEQYGTKEKMDKRLEMVDSIYCSILKNGYKTRKELLFDDHKGELLPDNIKPHPEDRTEVCIAIGRDGEFFFDDGRHRFSIAKILKLKSIPVRVIVRHDYWLNLRSEIIKTENKENLSDNAMGILMHPDIIDISKKFFKSPKEVK